MKIKTVREGIEPTIVVVNGFLTGNDDKVQDWLEVVDTLHPENRVIHAHWDASNLIRIAKRSGLTLVTLLWTIPVGIVFLLGASVSKRIAQDWQKALEDTELSGYRLASYLEEQDGQFILYGHSLGARVIYHAIKNTNRVDSIAGALLFGGAIGNDEPWLELYEKHPQLILFNCYSDRDWVLKTLYRLGTIFTNTPIGLSGIENSKSSLIYNINVSGVVSGHNKYKRKEVAERLIARVSVSNPEEKNEGMILSRKISPLRAFWGSFFGQ
ncbi:DUF726 domain-containing protein [Pseudoalteromonas pernae]|uniref:DUF726 domain-containing protein n=1 Tax=Pseudoalteromonas pernae TaxID=3118054 RepID=UPI003242100D